MAKRRGHGEGSIGYRDDKKLWIGQITLPTGKRKTKYAKTQKEVKAWLDEQKRQLHGGLVVANDKITYGDFLKRWVDEVARHTLRPSTLNSHASVLRRHIYPTLGDIKLSQLAPAHLQALYSQKLDEGLSKKTVKYIHWILHQSLAQALKWGLVARNVSEAVEVPVPKKHRVEPLSAAQVRQLLAALEDDRLYPFYVLLLSTGLRKGEALALTLDCLDLDDGVATVAKTLNFLPGQGLVTGETKSERSRRVVALPEFTCQVLAGHLAHRDSDSPYVFCTRNGTPFSPRYLIRHFKTALNKAGLPETIRIHDLRHTFVSFMLAENVPASDVQKMAGHASFSTTVDIYGHLMAGAQKEAAKKMNKLFVTSAPKSTSKVHRSQ
jgi:integrase